MMLRMVTLFTLGLLPAWAADKKPAVARAENDQVGISATLYDGKEAVRQQLGSDLGGYFTVIQVALSPKAGKALTVNKDDFLLRSDKDGQRCRPFAPSQIAGRAALVVSEAGGRGGVMGENPGPVWGGIPGTGGRPQRMGGDAATMGNTAESSTQATIDSGAKQKEDPVLTVLKQKALPEKETIEPVAGLVYFSLEGKHKPKDLELVYDGPAGKLSMRFRP
jgi:hypothetical protein